MPGVRLLLLFVLVTSASTTLAQALSPTAFFARCYAQFTGTPVPRGHALMQQVKAGSLTPVAACLSVFNKALLGADDRLAGGGDAEARAVLNTFYNFHRSWFPATKVEDITGHSLDNGLGTSDVYDSTEPALALTYRLFKGGSRYQDVLRDERGYVAFRTENIATQQRYGFTVSYPTRRLFGNYAPYDSNLIHFRKVTGTETPDFSGALSDFLVMPKIQVGDLIGVTPQFQTATVSNVSLTPLVGAGKYGELQPGLNFSYNFYSSFGGGVLGQPIYLMMNLGHEKGLEFNGADKLPRRWVENSMQSFLCTQFPALREADALPFVDPAAPVAFRKSSSCVRCHATLDRAAMTARNIVNASSDYLALQSGPLQPSAKIIETVTSYRAEVAPIANWSTSPVANFHRQTPTGALYFRSFGGNLVQTNLNGIASLGQALSDTDDFYQCAAKRYFEFFTGIKVALYDRGDPRFADISRTLSPAAAIDRKYIEYVAAELKQHQSLSKMIQTFLESDYYRMKDFRPTGGAP